MLNGLPVAADQSSKNNQFNVQFVTTAGEKGGVAVKFRNMDFAYDNSALANSLDRNDNLAALELSYKLLPETKILGEYRYGDVSYKNLGLNKDKESNYFVAGINYNPTEQVTMTFRAGRESRTRSSQASTSAPYAEISSNYAYSEGSYMTGGYMYTLEEPSDPDTYTDTKVNRFFATLQHKLSPLVTVSGSLTYEDSELQGRTGRADLKETTTRFGLGVVWQPTKNWSFSATYDVDHTASNDANRNQDRTRFGVGAKLLF